MSNGFEDWTVNDVLKHNARIKKMTSKNDFYIQYDKLLKPKRKSKYGANKVKIDGIKFDSKREAKRYIELKNLESAGEITNLKLQVPFELQPKFKNADGKNIRAITYIADFVYNDKFGKKIVEDSKGFKTKEYLLKKKLFEYKFNLKIIEV